MEILNDFILIDFMLKLLAVLVALGVLIVALRAFDKYTKVDFKNSFEGVRNDPKAFALYIGLRFIGVSILISSII
ncbi:hypothetical protein [Arcobacter roscoffensis]|uniref:DUF350 domain-containing protein n=1 Tax=Arcobacter roscoffensis TaxID=2961520 RepID=A0ABY5E3S0_9BACT|nr:hypothetical protein [Arcobacter roscoffensis]UTJ05381.1 hypothetical protein NJU99_08880 [Arcobacter roscoffensis]